MADIPDEWWILQIRTNHELPETLRAANSSLGWGTSQLSLAADEIDRLRADYAATVAERDRWREGSEHHAARADAAEAERDKYRSLCDQQGERIIQLEVSRDRWYQAWWRDVGAATQPAAEPPWPCIDDGRPCNDEACRPAAEPTAEVCEHDWQEYWDGALGYRQTWGCTRCGEYRHVPPAAGSATEGGDSA